MSDSTGGKTEAARLQAVKARDDLASTLDAIEDKLNVPKRVGQLGETVAASYRSNRVPFLIGGGAAAAVVIGLVAWALFSDD